MANLVIMESPSKALTVKGYLGSNYKVIACKGHVRDLPKSSFGIDIDNDFEAHYINIRGKGDLIREIRKEAKAANKIFIATDPDREGEAIAWHLATVLGLSPEKTLRVTFNEVTKNVVKTAIKEPRGIDMNLVNAQQTRRLLDRIVGYKLSPLLWKNVKNGLSAGRVQSAVTRLIVEREEEIRNFVPEEYWTIEATLNTADNKTVVVHFHGDKQGKQTLGCEEDAMRVVNAVTGKDFSVSDVRRATKHKTPAAPFTTSTLQQEAFKKLGFQSQRTMRVAQELYEGVSLGTENGGVQGLITYMRTDSQRISPEAQEIARSFISEKFGDRYLPATARNYKTREGAQDAHEAIRPANILLEPTRVHKYLSTDQYRLYKLIWERFIASQMESAELSTVTVDLECEGYTFHTGGYSVTFPGYMAVYEESEDDPGRADRENDDVKDLRLPDLNTGDSLRSAALDPARHFTEPPARYNDASLTRIMEEKGIGRPSTYNTIISTISRNYVTREGKAFVPTKLGEVTTDLMKEHFNPIVDYAFTAEMEDDLDLVEKGDMSMTAVLNGFWNDFKAELDKAGETLGKDSLVVPPEETDLICEKCGSRMIIKNGRHGKFAACPNYPKCRNTKSLTSPEEVAEKEQQQKASAVKEPVLADFKCEKCGADMVLRTGRYGSFYACSRYPECRFTKQKTKDLGVECPECHAKIVTKFGRNHTVFYSCERYPECQFSSWDMPTNETCPSCGKMLFRKKGKALLVCHDKECGYSREYEEAPETGNGDAEN